MLHAHPGIDFGVIIFFVYLGAFLTLILYLRREDRREGYPLESDPGGVLEPAGSLIWTPAPKTYIQPFGRGETILPNSNRDNRALKASRTGAVSGSPIIPDGDPMLAAIGPGSYAERAKNVDLTAHGDAKIVPMRVATGYTIARQDRDPRGYPVVGTDGGVAGSVVDLWVDRAEAMVRYLELRLNDGSRTVLLPIVMAKISNRRGQVIVDAITGAQFAAVPALANPEQVTFDEEERIAAYYGGGFLYATPSRAEPLL